MGPGEGMATIAPEPILKGMVSRLRPRYLPEDAAPLLQHTDLTDPTAPARRGGWALQSMTGATASKRFADAINFYPTSSNKYVYATQNGGKTLRNTDSTFAAWTEILDAATGLVSLDALTDDALFLAILDGAYLFRGSSAVAMITPSTDRYALDTNINTSPPRNVVSVCFAAERAWALASDGYLYYSTVKPTAATFDTNWDRTNTTAGTGAGRFQMSPHKGGKPVAVVPWKDDYILVFYDRYIELLIVDVNWSDLSNSSRLIVEPRYGCIAHRSVVPIGQQVFFLDQYGEYRTLAETINGQITGTTPLPISEGIKDQLPDSLNKSVLTKAHAVAFEDKIYLHVPAQADAVSTTEATYQAIYDTGRGVWTSWGQLAVSSGVLFTSQLRSGAQGEELWMTDGGNGSVAPYAKQPNLYRMTPATFADANQAGTLAAISWAVETRAWDGGYPENDKILDTVEVEFTGDTGTRVYVDVMQDESGVWEGLDPTVLIAGSTDDGYPIVYANGDIVYPLGPTNLGATRKAFSAGPQLNNHGRARTHRFRFRSDGQQTAVALARWFATLRILPIERRTHSNFNG